jgi:predicted DNA-binding transcriptional regulator AlpA
MATSSSDHATDCFLSAKQTRGRYGDVSDMWLWRRLHDDSGFPKPMIIQSRRLWRLSELVEWERCQTRAMAEVAA